MGDILPLAVLPRRDHVGTAVVVPGGSTFHRFVLMPAAAALPEAEYAALRQRIMATWRRVVHADITLFLLSGLYNYLVVAAPRHRGDGLYHALMGTKILLAPAAVFLASAPAGRSGAFGAIRRGYRRWLTIVVLVARHSLFFG